jgi:hypothetical protein
MASDGPRPFYVNDANSYHFVIRTLLCEHECID